jgi:hypothetical protein
MADCKPVLTANGFSFIFAANQTYMEQSKKSKGLYWLLFFISTAAFAFAIITHWEWLTLLLPFVCTFFVKAMDIM